ncbi:MAG: hypothetical protein ABL908_18440 [Hyphomicrobium sp.]
MQQSNIAAVFDTDKEYRAIESALLESARGRWFLAEHGRRARRLDGAMLEEAIGRLQSSIRQPPALLGQLKTEIEELTAFVAETRSELLARPAALSASESGEAAPRSTVSGILKAAEDMHEAAWSLQARHIDPEGCAAIARSAAAIYALSHQQAVESSRALRLSQALEMAVRRLSALRDTIMHELEIDGGGEVSSPATT